MRRFPGEVYWLVSTDERDPRSSRPYVLLCNCNDVDEYGTFAHCSTKGTEVSFGAAYHLVDPFSTQYNRTGFQEPTYVYPSRLCHADTDSLGSLHGRLIDDLYHIRDRLRDAFGLGSGTYSGNGRARTSARGTVAKLNEALAKAIETRFALVVTEPGYARQLRYQIIAPIYSTARVEPAHGDIVVPADAPISQHLKMGELLIDAIGVFSVDHLSEIHGIIVPGVDERTMELVDQSLRLNFGL